MASLAPLAMSSTKDELLNHLNLPPDTYALMAKETDRVYIWLTSEKSHLKSNCKRKPPYDWSDIQEKSKDEAMEAIGKGGDEYTDYYWRLAAPAVDCPNWIARWFLYHKFRYRDGRNRTHQRGSHNSDRRYHTDSGHGRHHRSRGHHHSSDYANQDDYYEEGLMNAGMYAL
ncbi:uncharacterized protein LY89DRAFT_105613 [Mollisia scopiformis]|uniref:Uncharacterized protein n=1 Tax=Mollisia scopiformis TaxID=149040 RepID=A0A194X4R3_MOLSC|nr:uncharacterized protein LY89DRAFT_105613 [Mollisia scopiformis]KUJ15168.1 hypothetical protein LY89DRAFT_105613 [Mollisia scopiformis]